MERLIVMGMVEYYYRMKIISQILVTQTEHEKIYMPVYRVHISVHCYSEQV